jgi:hypothetical protein
MTSDEALAILESANARAPNEHVKTPEVRAALKALLPYCRERWPLDQFWNSADAENPHVRSQNVNASLNGIRLQMKPRR